MDVLGVGHSNVGRVRTNNEDALLVVPDLGLYAVCDGMGGRAGGEVASSLAAATIERSIRSNTDLISRARRDSDQVAELGHVLRDSLRQACRDIHNRASSDPSLAGMGCTATVVVVTGAKVAMAHVGDTRLYLVRSDRAHQMSSDHTLAAEFIRQGTLDPDSLADHPHRHVLTRALGPQPSVEVETLEFDLVPGDRMVLCSDGLHDYLPSDEWLAERVVTTTVEELPDRLIEYALSQGGEDNVSVVAIGIDGVETEPVPVRSPRHALDLLGSSFLFGDLTLAQLSRVLDRCIARTYVAGETVWRGGETVGELLIVMAGSLRVESPDGQSRDVGPGHHLGESLVVRPRPVRATVIAPDQAQVLTLDGSSLLDLAARRPWLGVALLSRLVDRLSGEIDRLSDSQLDDLLPAPADLI